MPQICCITLKHTWGASLRSTTQMGPSLSHPPDRLPSLSRGTPPPTPWLGMAPGLGLPRFLLSTCPLQLFPWITHTGFPTTITWSLSHFTHAQHYGRMTHYMYTYTNYGFSSCSSSQLSGRSAGPDPSKSSKISIISSDSKSSKTSSYLQTLNSSLQWLIRYPRLYTGIKLYS
jgi:hypothetical protein